MILQSKKKNKGFVILFAVMLSSMILSISLGIAHLAIKEMNFSSSTKNGNDAFFAADVGIECALVNDKVGAFESGIQPIYCRGIRLQDPTTSNPWNFVVPSRFIGGPGLGGAGEGCATVLVEKFINNSVVPPAPMTRITSKGYNVAGLNAVLCTSTNPNRTQRQIQIIR